MCTLSVPHSSRRRLASVDIIKSHIFESEGCVPYLFRVQVGGDWREKILLSHIYSEVKDVNPIDSAFKSEKTCAERYY